MERIQENINVKIREIYNDDYNWEGYLRSGGIVSLGRAGKMLEGGGNCTVPGILSFPNWMREKPINWVNVTVSTIFSIYLFLMLAILCDSYVVPAVERLSFRLKMPYDIAGATLMAIATSAPELFVNCVGTFITEGDIGIGTIVGSSVFNTLAICGLCGVVARESIKLDWWPVSRDIIFYVISIVAMTVVIWDAEVEWYESLVLIIIFIIYLIWLGFDRKIRNKVRKQTEEETQEADLMSEDPLIKNPEEYPTFKERICTFPKESGVCYKIYWVSKYPMEILFALTIPTVRTIYVLSLINGIIWISVVSYLVSWFMTVFGYNLYIPDSVMGITFLAAGTSVPEAVSSVVVTQKGYGSMAICNSIGSNTFDILICLGIPWFVKSLMDKLPIYLDSQGMGYIAGTLLTTTFLMFIAFLVAKFKLGLILGILCIVMYAIYVIFSVTVEYVMMRPLCDH